MAHGEISATGKITAIIAAGMILASCAAQPERPETIAPPEVPIVCQDYWKDGRERLRYLRENGAEVTVLRADYAAAVVRAVNAQDPPTDWQPETVTVYRIGGNAELVFQSGDCIWSSLPMPARDLFAFIRSAIGQGA